MTTRPLEHDVLVVVPTHDHASTLELAVRSVLEQTFDDLDVVIVGDGVGDDTRDVAADLGRLDHRVQFLDRPESASRGEAARHEVITSSNASIVTYLGDDDLFWPDHVASMRDLIVGHDFAHPFPVVVEPGGGLRAFPTDLADPECVAWHLHPGHNTVSLTGATHTMELYQRVPGGWQAPPPGRWPDHFMWEQFFRLPGVRLATGLRATTVKPPAATHVGVDAQDRRTSLESWWNRMHAPGARATWDEEVADAVRRCAVESFMAQVLLREQVQEQTTVMDQARATSARRIAEMEAAEHDLVAELEACRVDLEARRVELDACRAEVDRRRAEIDACREELGRMRGTRTWRAHDRLVSVPLLRRLLARPPAT